MGGAYCTNNSSLPQYACFSGGGVLRRLLERTGFFGSDFSGKLASRETVIFGMLFFGQKSSGELVSREAVVFRIMLFAKWSYWVAIDLKS